MVVAGELRIAWVASLHVARIGALLLLLSSCASERPPPEYVPPRLELGSYGALGLVEFDAGSASDLGAAATREFLAAVHAAQPGTPVLELGDLASALVEARRDRVDPAAIRSLAARERVDAIWVGELRESEDEPRFSLDLEQGVASASARRRAQLSVRLIDGTNGATLWSAASERTIPMAAVRGTLGALPQVRTTSADEARTILVRDLVDDVTDDLRPRWVQR